MPGNGDVHGHSGITIGGLHVEALRLPDEARRHAEAAILEARRGGLANEFEDVEDRVRRTRHPCIGSGRDDPDMT